MPDRLKRIEEDVADLKGRFARHEKRHGDDAEMLGRVLDNLDKHVGNHHGRASTIRQGSIVATAITLIYVVAELIRQLLL